MIVDTSAIVAILLNEPEISQFRHAIEQADIARISAGSLIELTIVVRRRRIVPAAQLEVLLEALSLQPEPVTLAQALLGREAFLKFGQTSGHRARLNFGDCFAYALAKATGEPLLFKGDDFIHTDITPAL